MNVSFEFDALEFLTCERIAVMTNAEVGRYMTEVCEAFCAGQTVQAPFIGRIYWRRGTGRPAIPPAIKQAVWARDGGCCRQCSSDYKIEFDHVIPYSKGGEHTVENLQLLCKPCNRRKAAR